MHLSNIDDKLLERGTVMSLISGGDPDVSIKFEHINPYDMDIAATFMVISITEDDFDADDVDDAEEFAGDWESSHREIFESLEGVVVRINGQYRGQNWYLAFCNLQSLSNGKAPIFGTLAS